jgi:hypothetical protein
MWSGADRTDEAREQIMIAQTDISARQLPCVKGVLGAVATNHLDLHQD